MTSSLNYDQFMGALCLWREARGCNIDEKRAIWWVLLNRARDRSGRWPPSVAGVVLQYKQFSSFNMLPAPDLGANVYHCDPNANKWPLEPPTGTQADWQSFVECIDVVSGSLGVDPTNGATNYESEAQGHLPIWAKPSKITAQIGPFRFYRGV